ncbi:hypothetical protein ACFV2X_23415 [Streptomyces sp. NPDC059679]|uniref:hypothetical protein n=1 Tax=Streptomyces sp. NPDC059679 TaxID=3346903 RepID=UPI00367AA6A0
MHADAAMGGRGILAAACLDDVTAASVAATLQALAIPFRLLLLTTLRRSSRSVTELASEVAMEQSAVGRGIRSKNRPADRNGYREP